MRIPLNIFRTYRRSNDNKRIQKNWTQNFCSILLGPENSSPLEERTRYDLTIIGGGIVGSAVAKVVKEKSRDVKTILIEKESNLGKHQSSHNSGVIHSGIYYQPGSLKAQLCVKGAQLILKYCQENNIPYKTGGKLVVATDCSQIDILNKLYQRGMENGVQNLEMLCTLEDIIKVEPNAKGMQALWSPGTGNVDWQVVTEHFGKDFRKNGGDILFNNEVNCIKTSGDCNYPILIKCNENLFLKTKYLVLCGGLHSGMLSDMLERESDGIFISFRVDYQLLKNKYIPTNIYAVPDLELPFLGVHLSPRLDGSTLLGPTAVPAYKIEGYEKDEINLSYLKNTITSAGFQKMTKRYCSKCVDQVTKQICPNIQIKELQKLAHICEEDVIPGPTAIQTQLVNNDGTFTDDFVFEFFEGEGIGKKIINCRFMPSPAATSSLAIAEYVVQKFLAEFTK